MYHPKAEYTLLIQKKVYSAFLYVYILCIRYMIKIEKNDNLQIQLQACGNLVGVD